MSPWLTVFVKEVRENARDRRTLASALLYGPLVGPVLFAALLVLMMAQQRDRAEERIALPVAGAELAPNLVAWLRQNDVDVGPAPATADAESAVRARDADVVLRIGAHYADQWRAGLPAPVDLIFDRSRSDTSTTVERVRALLLQYSATVGALRLQARGVSPEVMAPVAIVERDVSTVRSRAGTLMAMLPYFLILSAFVGGMYLAIDTTSGERERQSLEPLLITPVSRLQIMIGKLLATSLYASASLLICVAAFAISLRLIPSQLAGFHIELPLATAALIVVVVVPIALLAAATQTVVAAMAKSFREAQTYIQFLILIPAIPSLMLVINPAKPEPWVYLTPLFGQSALISELVRDQSVSGWLIAGCSATTLLSALAFAAIAVRLYHSERLAVSV